MDENRTLEALYETRREIEALRSEGEPLDSPRLVELRQRHDDLLAGLSEQSIVPIAWEDDWSPALRRRRSQVLAAGASFVLLILFLFVAAPEWIGDHPYNVF